MKKLLSTLIVISFLLGAFACKEEEKADLERAIKADKTYRALEELEGSVPEGASEDMKMLAEGAIAGGQILVACYYALDRNKDELTGYDLKEILAMLVDAGITIVACAEMGALLAETEEDAKALLAIISVEELTFPVLENIEAILNEIAPANPLELPDFNEAQTISA